MNSRFPIFNTWLSITNLNKVIYHLSRSKNETSEYILFPDLSVLSQATQNEKLAGIINNAFMAMPDGKPSELIARLKGFKDVRTVSGYKLILRLLKESDKTHFFYGSTDEKLKLIENFLRKYDMEGTRILGFKEAPFVALDEIEHSLEIRNDLKEINKLRPDFIWVGLSSPKQDYLLHHHHQLLDTSIMLGVGGVFDYLSGQVSISPDWVKKIGMRWFYRLLKEPKRLFPKYTQIFKNLFKYLIRNIF